MLKANAIMIGDEANTIPFVAADARTIIPQRSSTFSQGNSHLRVIAEVLASRSQPLNLSAVTNGKTAVTPFPLPRQDVGRAAQPRRATSTTCSRT